VASLFHVGLGNAAAATALALAAAVVCFTLRGRRPAIAHALWLLVLLKLLTPPLWTLPLWTLPVSGWFHSEAPAPVDPSHPAAAVTMSFAEVPDDVIDEEGSVTDKPLPAPAPSARHDADSIRTWLTRAIAITWLVGSAACLALVFLRSCRFARVLRHATPAPPVLTRRAAELSSRMGIGRSPEVWLVPGAVCPMLWALFARPQLLLPAGLWSDLTDAQRDSLIAHELAHLRRRDHWVRLVEVAATVLYWWHPVAWWARRELREAEEQCCDAWVVWSLPRSARPYMNAILKAIDFVSDAAGSHAGWPRAAVPPVASGMASGQFRHLERRLSMIRQNESGTVTGGGRTLGRAGLLGVCAGAIGLLPLAPSLAQQDPRPRSVTVVTTPRAETVPEAGGELEVNVVPTTASVELVAPDQVSIELAPANTTSVRPEAPAAGNQARTHSSPETADPTARVDVEQARQEVERLSRELEAAKARLAVAEGGSVRSIRLVAPSNRPRREVLSEVPDGRGGGPYTARTSNRRPDDQQRRLDELERKLDRLLDEVQTLKDGRQGRDRATTPPVSIAR